MSKDRIATTCLFAVGFALGLQSTTAWAINPAYVDAYHGSDSNTCAVTQPCASLKHALSQLPGSGGQVVILVGGVFAPVIITKPVSINGPADSTAEIKANLSATPSCVGASAGNCGSNLGYAIEINAGGTDTIKISHVSLLQASGKSPFAILNAGKVRLSHVVFRGGSTGNLPMVQIAPRQPLQVSISDSDVGFNSAGAILLKPRGSASAILHMVNVSVHNASFGLLSDGSSTTGTVHTLIKASSFYAFNQNGIEALAGTSTDVGTALTRVSVAAAGNDGVLADGTNANIILDRSVIIGNNNGAEQANSGTIDSTGTNVFGNTTADVVGGPLGTQSYQ